MEAYTLARVTKAKVQIPGKPKQNIPSEGTNVTSIYSRSNSRPLSFVNWIVYEAEKRSVEKLFFLARDGYYLMKVFRMVQEAVGLKIDSVYMYASRRLLNLPCIKELDDESIRFLITPNPLLNVRDFIERIGLDWV